MVKSLWNSWQRARYLFFFLFLIRKNLHRVIVPIAASIRTSDTEVKNTQMSTPPKAMDANISTLSVDRLKSGWLLLLTLATLLHLLLLRLTLLFLLLLMCLLLYHRSC